MKKYYEGGSRREIVFPVGGIGTGCIGLDGTGRLREWEIFNRPNKYSLNGYSHFGIKVERGGKTVDARAMNSDLFGPYNGGFENSGIGPARETMAGAPHFRDARFGGEFPLAEIEFLDDTFPGSVKLKAFNPFIPSDEDDSGLPAAFYTAEVTNTGDEPLTYTFELTVNNPSEHPHINRAVESASFRGIELADTADDEKAVKYGRLVFGVPADCDMQTQLYWYRGGWFDSLSIFWQDFTAPGRLKERTYPETAGKREQDHATVAVSASVAPGETWSQRFLIAWYYPNCEKYWFENSCIRGDVKPGPDDTWKNYYAKLFKGAADVAEYSMREWDRLERETVLFHDALYASDLPEAALEAVGSTISVLKSPTVMRLTEGEFVGWEGAWRTRGSCEGSCTHVWNYAFALPFLFPRLERSMRELDYTYNQNDDGGMAFRLMLPPGIGRSAFRPCVDGQMGGIIKTYREWKLSGDDEWLKKWWPKVKKSLEYAWAPTNTDRWDPEREGVITGRQHHTLDMELFGPNAWLNGFYVGALKAAAEMAEAMGDADAALFSGLYEKGRAYTDDKLFNGEYYCQNVDIRDKEVLTPFLDGATIFGGSTFDTYWNDEAGQIKYQIAGGCIIDQVLAQWMCELSGVGEILDREHVDSALKSIYRNNYKESFRDYFNPCRIFALNDDSGLVICTWPEGVEKPVVPIPYGEESMHGFEYQAASHMIMHGFEEEGMNVVKGIRKRYDGTVRNPWNEIECGNNYARSMASYALLLVYSGFRFDMRKKRMGMLPLHDGTYFWAVDGAWGTCTQKDGKTELKVLYGALTLGEWVVPAAEKIAKAALNGKNLPFAVKDGALAVGPAELTAGDVLTAE